MYEDSQKEKHGTKSLDPESIKSRTATLLKTVTFDHPLLILSCTVKNR